MDKSKTQNSFSGAIISRVSTSYLSVGNWATGSFETASLEVGRAVKDAARLLKIITFLHSAKDLQSLLRLYGIEDSHAFQSSKGNVAFARFVLRVIAYNVKREQKDF